MYISSGYARTNLFFSNAGTVALNLKAIVVFGKKKVGNLLKSEKSERFFCKAALWVAYSNCSELNPDHECTVTFTIGYSKSRETAGIF